MDDIADGIRGTVAAWPGVTVGPHRFGGTEFRVHGHEIGHLHGSHLADLPFPVAVRKQLVARGRAALHHLLPDTGWVSLWISGPGDVPRVVELFRLNYDRIAHATRAAGAPQARDRATDAVTDTTTEE